ncbi:MULTISPECIES: methyl-accepting chemotaxis protein [Thalassospira]|uniref:Methyl-accepting chemotaxis protein n=1 Tax=Thalassospira povalilytica TaxID=732237 RepID=A0ABX4R620_9PROT|nr:MULTISPECIES: methyl-accepting chemotaxis protein [Thalassospira]PKR48692.1 methyl-accepting chemotaxis protein [Thalassospira povalilytica]
MPSVFRNLRISHRLYSLVGMLVVFIGILGAVGVYTMSVIGHELEEVAHRDLPLNGILEKITQHQLEQAILMEKALRIANISAHDKSETFESVRAHFTEVAHLTDDEIATAHQMVKDFLAGDLSDAARTEFEKVLIALERIEKEHLDYELHIEEIFDQVTTGNYDAATFEQAVIKVEEEQSVLDHEVEALLSEVSAFTRASMEVALQDEIRGQTMIAILSSAATVLAIILSVLLGRSISGPMKNLTSALGALADGKLDTPIPASKYRDEVADIGDAMKVFQANMIRARELEEEQKKIDALQMRRQDERNHLVSVFGSSIGAVFGRILNSSESMVNRASGVRDNSGRTYDLALTVATEAEQSSGNASSLSSAVEEMVASIEEISNHVSNFTDVSRDAVRHSEVSREEMKNLQEVASEIGEVVSLITSIAQQTSMLSLNATIEAARAGEMGKGFAVVAGEVKTLAKQTSNATDEIAQRITRIQEVADRSARAIGDVAAVIESIDEYVTGIAGAVEQQNAATREISRNVTFVSESATRVAGNMGEIRGQVEDVSGNASEVHTVAETTAKEAALLSREVDIFLAAVQNSDIHDDTYSVHDINVGGRITFGEQAMNITLSEISCAHVRISPSPDLRPGEVVELVIDGINQPINARVARHEDGHSILQFPLDGDHLAVMRAHIDTLTTHNKQAA